MSMMMSQRTFDWTRRTPPTITTSNHNNNNDKTKHSSSPPPPPPLTSTTTITAVEQAVQQALIHDPFIMENASILSSLELGIPVLKVANRSGKFQTRVLTLSSDRLGIFCTHYPMKVNVSSTSTTTPFSSDYGFLQQLSSRIRLGGYYLWTKLPMHPQHDRRLRDRYVRYIDMADLDAITTGVVGTVQLEHAWYKQEKKKKRLRTTTCGLSTPLRLDEEDASLAYPRDQIVSIHHHGHETLDVLVPDADFRRDLVLVLRKLQSAYQAALRTYQSIPDLPEALLLRYIWYDYASIRRRNHRPHHSPLPPVRPQFQKKRQPQPQPQLQQSQEPQKEQHGRLDDYGTATMDARELPNLLHRINVGHMSASKIAQLVQDCIVTSTTTTTTPHTTTTTRRQRQPSKRRKNHHNKHAVALTVSQVLTLLQKIKAMSGCGGRSMANQLWDDVFGSNVDEIAVDEFCSRFCHAVQGDAHWTPDDVLQRLGRRDSTQTQQQQQQQVRRMDGPHLARDRDRDRLTRLDFEKWLLHPMNGAYDPQKLYVARADTDHDRAPVPVPVLDKPLSRYWINTSHNTYLTGDQLTSTSSVECYLRALHRGCKCLEVDVWEGGLSSEGIPIPIVYHGYTATSRIRFLDIIRVVASYMDDHPTTYPVILSLENHCSHLYQTVMAHILLSVLKQFLYIPTDHDRNDQLPSPEALRGKVVIKGKRPPEDRIGASGAGAGAVVGAGAGAGSTVQGALSSIHEGQDDSRILASASTPSIPSMSDPDPSMSMQTINHSSSSQQKSTVPEPVSNMKPPKIVKELARLTLLHGTRYISFEQSLNESPSCMHSMSESHMSKILDSNASAAHNHNHNTHRRRLWQLYNVHHLTRCYPSGTRVDSSNYNPLRAWACGCQLVALNFQTSDTPLWMNDGLFRQYDHCGYVLKPASVLGKYPALSSSSGVVVRGALEETINRFDAMTSREATAETLLSTLPTTTAAAPWSALRAQLEAHERVLKETECMETTKNTTNLNLLRTLTIRVLSGSCLPKPCGARTGECIDPYVQVTVHDVWRRGKDAKATYHSRSHTTSSIANNGLCPVWNHPHHHETTVTVGSSSVSNEYEYEYEEYESWDYCIHSPDVALVQFALYDADLGRDDPVACAVIPIACLRSGVRSIQLFDMNHNTRTGPFGMACLLVDIRYYYR